MLHLFSSSCFKNKQPNNPPNALSLWTLGLPLFSPSSSRLFLTSLCFCTYLSSHPLWSLHSTALSWDSHNTLHSLHPVALLLLTDGSLGKYSCPPCLCLLLGNCLRPLCGILSLFFQEVLALQGGIWANISLLPFQWYGTSLGQPIKELWLPTGTIHVLLDPQHSCQILSNPQSNWAKVH